MSAPSTWPLEVTAAVRQLWAQVGWLPKTRAEAHAVYRQALDKAGKAGPAELRAQFLELGRYDFYFFLCYVLYFADFRYLDNDWTFHMARMVQAEPWGFADFWPRGHMKTTLITEAYTLWESLYFPETTTAIFSMTMKQLIKIANKVMQLLEQEHVKWLFPDVLWEKPARQAPSWNTSGLMFKRKTIKLVATIEFHSILSLPTGSHFDRIRMDDLVDQRYTTNQEMVEKAVTNFRLMTPLRAQDAKVGMVATRYDNLDAYHFILEQGSFTPRVFYPTDNGELDGNLLLMKPEDFAVWVRDLGPYQTACQMFQKPELLSLRRFLPEWIQPWDAVDQWSSFNVYIIVDPASRKGKANDYTAMAVVGLGADQNVYLIDGVREQLDPTERANTLMQLVIDYNPKAVFYEESGMSADVHFLRTLMGQRQHNFPLYGVTAGGNKKARIETLQPLAAAGRLWMPRHLHKMGPEGPYDLIQDFLRFEWGQWPKPTHDDFLDALCRVTDGSTSDTKKFPIQITFPKAAQRQTPDPDDGKRWDVATKRMV